MAKNKYKNLININIINLNLQIHIVKINKNLSDSMASKNKILKDKS